MPPSDQNSLIVTCYGCWKKLRAATKPGKKCVVKCPYCGEMFFAYEDGHPERMIEVWFSKLKQYQESTIDRVRHFINRSTKTLDVAVYSLTHDWLIPPFEQAKLRGVKIRILVDSAQSKVKGSDVLTYAKMDIPVSRDVHSGFMHHKFAIRDGKAVLTGSYNWTKSAEDKHRENFLILHYPHAVKAYRDEFERLWEANLGGLIVLPKAEPPEITKDVVVASPS